MGFPSFLTKLLPTTINGSTKAYVPTVATPKPAYTLPTSTFISTGMPVWKNLSELIYLLECYYTNPIVNAIINIKAEAYANIRFKVKDLKTGEIIPLSDYEADKGKLKQLIKKPNPLQSTMEMFKQYKVNREVFGNAYIYASVPVGWESKFTYQDITSINNLPPYCTTPVLTGKWLDAEKKEDIISKYIFNGFNGKKREMNPNTVLHLNNTNIFFDSTFTEGKSELLALKMPISNIFYAFESRNVMIRKRGALGVFTSEKKDESMGSLPLTDDEIKIVQEEFKKYGLLDGQYSHIISPMPLKYQKTAMSVKELMLFEEVEADTMAIATSLGVPELLVKNYIKGGTFENLNASERRLYDSTIIPEATDDMVGLNNFLGTEELGIELIGSYDHVNVLQENKKEEAETNSKKEQTALSAFKIGAIVYDDYLNAIGMPADPTIGQKRIWDLDEKQLQALEISISNSKKNGNDQ